MSPRLRRIARIVVMSLAVAGFFYWRFTPRPERFGIATVIDGPAPQNAERVVIFLHGLGRGFGEGGTVARALRDAGLPGAISIVLMRAPPMAMASWDSVGAIRRKSARGAERGSARNSIDSTCPRAST